MPIAQVGRYALYYEQRGTGPAVVLIHGLAGDLRAWANVVAELSPHYGVLVFDNRGAGRSTQLNESVSTVDLARDALGLMDEVGIESAHVVGRSMGGSVAQHMALLAPERVSSLVLCASFGRLDPLGRRVLTNMREALEWRESWADHARHSVPYFVSHEFFNSSPAVVEDIENLIGGETRLPACYIQQNIACLEHDTLEVLSDIACPTLILAGGQDPICSLTATSWLADAIPGAETVVFEDSSHFFLVEEQARFLEILLGWLHEHSAA